MKKNIIFLKMIRCRIEALPWSVWENEDIKDESKYDKKIKRLKGRVSSSTFLFLVSKTM